MESSKKTVHIKEKNKKLIVETADQGGAAVETFSSEKELLRYLAALGTECEYFVEPDLIGRFSSLLDAMEHNKMQELAAHIQKNLFKGYGFCLLVFDHDKVSGRMNYISNSQREDVIKAMQEFIEKTAGSWGTHEK